MDFHGVMIIAHIFSALAVSMWIIHNRKGHRLKGMIGGLTALCTTMFVTGIYLVLGNLLGVATFGLVSLIIYFILGMNIYWIGIEIGLLNNSNQVLRDQLFGSDTDSSEKEKQSTR
jgi:hypothetical protein